MWWQRCLAAPAPASSAGHYVSVDRILYCSNVQPKCGACRACIVLTQLLMVDWVRPADGTGREFMRTIDHEFTVDPEDSPDGEVGCLCCSQRRRCPECLAELPLQRCPAVR